MTDMTLEEAIAEVKRTDRADNADWIETWCAAQRVIMAAISSGDLIPASDARLAVALAYQRAAACIEANPQPCSPVYPGAWTDDQIAHYESGQLDASTSFQTAIFALADTDALAEVQALREERDDLAKVIDDTESHYGLSSNGNMWRFWSDKARATASRNTALQARAKAAEAEVARLRLALTNLINHTHNCEEELTEDLHHVDFCGESLPLTKARAALAAKGGE